MQRLLRIGACVVASTLTIIGAAGSASADDSTSTTESSIPVESTSTTTTLLPGPIRTQVKVAYLRVVLNEQRTYVYNSSKRLVATLPVSTGLLDTTPVGRFKVFSKSTLAIYSPNPRERMRWMVRFTKGKQGDNIGFHSIPFLVSGKGETKIPTPLGITPSSHGCVRVGDRDAKWLYDNVAIGTPVIVQASR